MAQCDWKQYFFVVFDDGLTLENVWYRSREEVYESVAVLKAWGWPVMGVGVVRGKVPEVQRWLAANALPWQRPVA